MADHERPGDWKHERQDLSGKRVVISGGSKGIGRLTALLLASKGAKVLAFARGEEALREAAADAEKAGAKLHTVVADAAKPEDIARVFREADEQLGGLDVLINNAAEPAQAVDTTDPEQIDYQVRENLVGYLVAAHEAIERMEPAGSGHIVNIGSMSAHSKGAGSGVYVATKSGIRGWSEALRKEVRDKGIKVTLIEPGLVGTDFGDHSPEEQREQEAEGTMLTAEDIAEAVYYSLAQPQRCDILFMQVRPRNQSED